MYHSVVNVDIFLCDAAECAAITLKVHGMDATVMFIYTRPEVSPDPRELLPFRQRCAAFAFPMRWFQFTSRGMAGLT